MLNPYRPRNYALVGAGGAIAPFIGPIARSAYDAGLHMLGNVAKRARRYVVSEPGDDDAKEDVSDDPLPPLTTPGSNKYVPYWHGKDVCGVGGSIPKQISVVSSLFFPCIHTTSLGALSADNPSADVAGVGMVLLNNILLGSASYNRIGRTVSLKSLILHLDIHAFFQYSGVLDQNSLSGVCRLCVVYDKQPNGVNTSSTTNYPKWSDVFLDYNASGGTYWNAYSSQNPVNADRFEVLYDKMFALPKLAYGGATASYLQYNAISQDRVVDVNIDLGNRCVKHSDVSGVGYVVSGALYLMSQGNNTTITSNAGSPYTENACDFVAMLQYAD